MTNSIDIPISHEPMIQHPDRMWIGSDVQAATDCIIQPGQTTIPIYFPPGSTYPAHLIRDPKAEANFCMRSRLAQLGGNSLAFGRKYMGDNGEFMIVQNLGNSAIKLNQGDGIGCQFDFSGGHIVMGQELVERALDRNGLNIEGAYGQDWFLYDDHHGRLIPRRDEKRMRNAFGLALRLKNQRWKIKTVAEPIHIGTINNYREFLDGQVLEELRPGEHYPFWVGETRAVVHLAEGLNGILNIAGHVGKRDFFQTRSTLMQGGNGRTSWPIRAEFIDAGTDRRQSTASYSAYNHVYMLMSLYRDKRLGAGSTVAV